MPPALEAPNANSQVKSTDFHILVIRSASRNWSKTILKLNKEFPGARITVLGMPVNGAPTQAPSVLRVLPVLEGKRLSWPSLPATSRKALQEERFDLAIALYNSPEGTGYSNVHRLALKSGAPEIRGYFPDGSYRCLTARSIFKEAWRERTALGWIVVNLVTSAALLAATGILMIVEGLSRMVPFTERSPKPSQTGRMPE